MKSSHPTCAQSINELELHLWCIPVMVLEDPALEEACQALLNADERLRAARFRFAADRRAFVLGRALLRTSLSLHAEVAPADWQFTFNSQGKPRIAACHGPAQALSFNLSHTRQQVVLVLGRQQALGVDIESIAPEYDPSIAERFFGPNEVQTLNALPPAAQAARFTELWSLKESYLKARGTGLALGLEGICFDLAQPHTIVPRLRPPLNAQPLGDHPERWYFTLLQAGSDHRIAVCSEQASGPPTLLMQDPSLLNQTIHPTPPQPRLLRTSARPD